MKIMIITMTIIRMIITKKIIINTSKIIIKDKIIEMIEIIIMDKSFSEKIYINIKVIINTKTNMIKTKRGIIRSLPNIASKSHTAIIHIQKTITGIRTKIAIINIELGKYIILNYSLYKK